MSAKHEPKSSINALKQAARVKKARFARIDAVNTDSNKKNDDNEESPQFGHKHAKTNHALQHAKMVEKGKKFWEQKEEYERMSELEWWQLKAAKDFETGVG
eukprot:501047_1